MKSKRSKAPGKLRLVRCELVEITDPKEQAEIDRRFREAERAVEGEFVIPSKPKPRKKR